MKKKIYCQNCLDSKGVNSFCALCLMAIFRQWTKEAVLDYQRLVLELREEKIILEKKVELYKKINEQAFSLLREKDLAQKAK